MAYVKQLVEKHSLPNATDGFSTEELTALEDTRLQEVAERPEYHTIASRGENSRLQTDLRRAADRPAEGSPGAGVAASQPPLYYALESIPYVLGTSGTLLDRIALMRLFSALFAGITALFIYLFVREALPAHSWAWITAGLAVSLTPLLGFMSGAVNPDAMLSAVSAVLFFAFALAFRRGFSHASAVFLGSTIAVGLATKLNFVGLLPGALVGMLLLAYRESSESRRKALISLAIGLGIALSPAIVYGFAQAINGHTGLLTKAVGSEFQGSLWNRVSYIWGLYLPRLPGMHNYFAGLFTTRQLWFNAYVGQLGWLDTPFPGWVEALALVPAGLIAGLCVRSLALGVGEVRSRASELITYFLIAIGLMIVVGASGYAQLPRTNAEFAQIRYLLPLLPLLGLVLALAARGAGRRWGPAVGATIVMLFLAHDVFSQLQVVARYYG